MVQAGGQQPHVASVVHRRTRSPLPSGCTGCASDVLPYTGFHSQNISDRMSTPPESVMTVQEVADYLRVNQRTVYRLAVGRKLPGFKVGATWRFKRIEIDAWIEAQSRSTPQRDDAS
jgi:excisionase family DNA binding protein